MNQRQIKFRIWNNKTKQWIEGPNEESCLDGVNLFGETILLGGFLYGVSIEDLNEIVALQYTGLKDKNGREIFEGDILIYKLDYNESQGGQLDNEIDYVHFDHATFFWGNKLKCALNEYLTGKNNTVDLEIIGNIYDNPELIKE